MPPASSLPSLEAGRSRPRGGAPDASSISARIHAQLRRVFGLRHLRAGQEEVIRHVLSGRDTLALMATGAGKSLCYQLPATLLPGCTLVVSPLIALMKDQCDKLRAIGIAAVQLNSGQLAIEREKAEQAVRDGSARIIITTPEHLSNVAFMKDMAARQVSLLVIDEAHCISQWGHDFRPAFLEVGTARERLGRPVVLALTATATQEAIQDVMQQLDLPDMRVVNTGLYRPNLIHAVDHASSEESKAARLLTLLDGYEGQGLVYTSTVKAAEAVHELLQQRGESVTLYHGHLPSGRRKEAQDAYMRGQARIMVATSAFGLGVDKADTRFVIHYQMPASLEMYYQEAGRAGRDGETAHCTLLYLPQDRRIQQFFLTGRYPHLEDMRTLYAQLSSEPPGEHEAWTLPLLLEASDRPRTKMQLALMLMRKQGAVHRDTRGRLKLRHASLDDQALEGMLHGYAERRALDRSQLEGMVFYCQSGLCRWQMLLQHFDQAEDFDRCGHCDNCLRMAQAQSDAEDAEEAAAEMPKDDAALASRFEVGAAVRVPRYGRGRVSGVDDVGVTVQFANGPQRCFLPQYVKAL